MKRCPTCDKTFDDNLKFCQIDGTSLVDDAPEAVDPYKTMVASKDEIAAAMASMSSGADEPEKPADEPVLDLPSPIDANKTQVVSEAELRAEMAKMNAEDNVIDVPPIGDVPEPPKFNEPEPAMPSFDAPPASPFGEPQMPGEPAVDKFAQTSPPIPSPFGESKPPSMEPSTPFEHSYSEPEPEPDAESSYDQSPQFAEPEPAQGPFDQQQSFPASEPVAQSSWTPNAPQETDMQNPQNFGQNAPMAGGPKLNQTLPIVSLIAGIVSLCCYISPLTGLVALITGYLGMKNANNDPANYGGKTLAIIGMILGGIFFVLGILTYIYILFMGGMSVMMQMADQAR